MIHYSLWLWSFCVFELFSFLTRVKDISVLEKEKKTLKKECEVHSFDIINLHKKILEWKLYAENKKEILVATVKEKEEL